jgi:DNA-binding response OmpR family regulator
MIDVLKGKRLLVVDDDEDICSVIAQDLSMCEVETARTFDAARAKLEDGRYDAIILDIMGVRGYDLLATFGARAPCIVLTARARKPDDLERARAGGAALYVPKIDIGRLDVYLTKVLTAKEPLWPWLFQYHDFTRWFGEDWRPPETP